MGANSAPQNLTKPGFRLDFIGTVPKSTAATEKMVARGHVRGRGTAFRFSPDIVGKTFKVTDSTATVTTEKTYTFKRTDFADLQAGPTLAEIVAALNTLFDDDVTPIVASAGADGRLIITGAATGTTNVLTIGKGTANLLLGFPDLGTVEFKNGTGVTLTLDASFTGVGFGLEALHMMNPRVTLFDYTGATGVQAQVANFTATWTPANRALVIVDTSNAARECHAIVEL